MKIFFSNFFKVQLKKLKKKFPNVKDDLLSKGKSGGFRVYVYLYRMNNLLVHLCIYHKSQKESITENELKYYFDRAIEELAYDLK